MLQVKRISGVRKLATSKARTGITTKASTRGHTKKKN